MFEHLKIHTGKLLATWLVGTVTWLAEATQVIGFLGAIVGFVAGAMLVAIRWDDFMDSNVMRRLRGLPRKEK